MSKTDKLSATKQWDTNGPMRFSYDIIFERYALLVTTYYKLLIMLAFQRRELSLLNTALSCRIIGYGDFFQHTYSNTIDDD